MIALDALRQGDRRALAKAITLVESQLHTHQHDAQALLEQALPYSGHSLRIGISGTPGVGKSTFIERFGLHLLNQGKKLAVLAVDPSSPVSGGSIMGDKTRMQELSREPNAYIRPSPSAGELGGVAQKTRESLLLCEAAGFDVIIIETVGVGQSEYEVAGMVDFFLVLMQPSAGDELQGIKKGIVELADGLAINKADGDLAIFAEQAQANYQRALDLLSHNDSPHDAWRTKVMSCSALHNQGIDAIWQMIQDYESQTKKTDVFTQKRAQQNCQWMEHILRQLLLSQVASKPQFKERKRQLKQQVITGEVTPLMAAKHLFDFFSAR